MQLNFQLKKEIHLSITEVDQLVQLRIGGAPAAEESRLFKKFAHLSLRPTAGESSSGLGLSPCKKIYGTDERPRLARISRRRSLHLGH